MYSDLFKLSDKDIENIIKPPIHDNTIIDRLINDFNLSKYQAKPHKKKQQNRFKRLKRSKRKQPKHRKQQKQQKPQKQQKQQKQSRTTKRRFKLKK